MADGQQVAPAPIAPGGRKKGNKGCWIALAVVLALLVLGTIGVGVAIWAVAQNPDVQRITRVMGEGVRMMSEAQNAPGAREVRALGCDQAMVIDTERVLQLAGQLVDAGPGGPGQDEPRTVITCQKVSGGIAPSCDQVAQTYLQAVPGQSQEFAVMVQVSGHDRPLCSRVYNASGQSTGAFDESQAPQLPPPGQPATP